MPPQTMIGRQLSAGTYFKAFSTPNPKDLKLIRVAQ